MHRAESGLPSSQISQVIDALSLLSPCEVAAIGKVRIGNPAGDGGYVLADRLRPEQSVYSYGISTEISFDLELARRGLQLFLYDHTIAGPPSSHPGIRFRREGVAPDDRPEASLFRVARHVAVNGHAAAVDMILKMDVEGAEWDVLDRIEPELLARFEQVVLELHRLGDLRQGAFRKRFRRCLTKLRAQFHLIHVHANNVAGIANVAGLPVPGTLEVTWLRKDLGEATPWRSFVPSALDAPNSDKQPDHVLGFFPFLPTDLSASALTAGLREAGWNARVMADRRQEDHGRARAEMPDPLPHAVGLLARKVEGDPNDAAALSRFGRALAAIGRHEDAADSFRRAIAIRPDVAVFHYDFGKSLRALGALQAAAETLTRAVELNPKDPAALHQLGRALAGAGRHDEAVAALGRASALDGGQPHIHRDLGRSLRTLRRHAEAAEAFARWAALAPDDATALHAHGRALATLNRHGEAVGVLQRTLEVEPDRTHAAQDLRRSLDALQRDFADDEQTIDDAGACMALCLLRPVTERDRAWLAELGPMFTEVITRGPNLRLAAENWRGTIAASTADWVLPVMGELPDRALVIALRRRVGIGVGAVCHTPESPGTAHSLLLAAPLKACIAELDATLDWSDFLATALARLRVRPLAQDGPVPTLNSRFGEVWLVTRALAADRGDGPGHEPCEDRAMLDGLTLAYRRLGYQPLVVRWHDPPDPGEIATERLVVPRSVEAIRRIAIRRQPVVVHVLAGAGREIAEACDGLAGGLIHAVDRVADHLLAEWASQRPRGVYCASDVWPDSLLDRIGVQPPRVSLDAKFAGLVASSRRRIAVAVGSGIGNMVLCSPAIRRIAEYFDQPVDLILNADYAGCSALFADAPWVGSIFRKDVGTSICFDVVLLLYTFAETVPAFNADRLYVARWSLPFSMTRTMHEADYNLLCARTLLGVPYHAGDIRRMFVGAHRPGGLTGRRVGLHGGCKSGIWEVKKWPFFEDLASRLSKAGFEVVSLGTADEHVPGTVDATGTSLAATIATIASCSYVIANDSGLMHVADAIGVPLTAIFAPTSVTKNGPLAPTSQVVSLAKPCVPCQFDRSKLAACRCIGEIGPDTVWERVAAHIAQTRQEDGQLCRDTRQHGPTAQPMAPLVVFSALAPDDRPALPPGAVIVGCDWTDTGSFPTRSFVSGFLDANAGQAESGAGYVCLSPHFVYPADYLFTWARHFAAHGGQDLVVGGMRYDATSQRLVLCVRQTNGETMLGLIALGCFSFATLRAASATPDAVPLRILGTEAAFRVVDAVFPSEGLRFRQAMDAIPLSAAEHQLGFAQTARAARLPLADRLCFVLDATETPEDALAQIARPSSPGRTTARLIELGEYGLAAKLILRRLSSSDLFDLDYREFGDLVQAVRTIGLVAEFVEVLRANLDAIAMKYFGSITALLESAALVLAPEELGSLVLACMRASMNGPAIRPIHLLIEIARRYCSATVMAELARMIDHSGYAVQLADPLLLRKIGDGLWGGRAPSFTLPTTGLTDRDFTAAVLERPVLDSLLASDRATFIEHANRLVAMPDGTSILSKLARSFTSDIAAMGLRPADIRYAADAPRRDTLELAIILGDADRASPWLDSGVLASTDPLVVAWRSRRGDYGPLNALLARWLSRAGAAPIGMGGKDRAELFRSCLSGRALPVARDRGRISVILAARDPDLPLLRMAVQSVLAQTYRNLELIVVDDASTGTGATALQALTTLDPRVRLLHNPRHAGPYRCRNLALDVATGTFVAFHDSDDVAHPQRLELQVEALLGQEFCQLCFSTHLRFDKHGALQFASNHDKPEVRGDGPVTAVCRRAVFDAVGPFAEIRSRGDIEMRWRIQVAYGSHAVRTLEAPLMYCAGGSANLSLSATVRFEEYVALFRRAFRQRAVPPILEDRFAAKPAGRLAVPIVLSSRYCWAAAARRSG